MFFKFYASLYTSLCFEFCCKILQYCHLFVYWSCVSCCCCWIDEWSLGSVKNISTKIIISSRINKKVWNNTTKYSQLFHLKIKYNFNKSIQFTFYKLINQKFRYLASFSLRRRRKRKMSEWDFHSQV